MGISPRSRLKLTVQRRILLLLFDHMECVDDYEVPEMISQEGIGRELGLRQTHVSRALSELNDAGLIVYRSSRIKSVGRKKKAYFLTDEGLQDVRNYIDEISGSKVPFRTRDGKIKLKRLSKVKQLISRYADTRISYHQLFTDHFDGNEIGLPELGPDMGAIQQRKVLYGRDRELTEIEEAVDEGSRFISITGIAGIGKTSLLVSLSSCLDRETISYMTLTEWTSPEKVLLDLSKVLSKYGKTRLWDHLSGERAKDIVTSIEKLGKDLEGIEGIIILDDLHKARPSIEKVLATFKDLYGRRSDTVIITASRKRPDFYNRRDVVVSRIVKEVRLSNLDPDSSRRMLKDKGVPREQIEMAFNAFKGHPLALEMFSMTWSDSDLGKSYDFEDFIRNEVLGNLSEDEMFVLRLASTYPKPIDMEGLIRKEVSDRSIVDGLCGKFLLMELKDRRVKLHDSIKAVVRGNMTDEEKERYYDIAVEFLSGRGSEEDILNKLVILRKAGRKDELVSLVLEEGDILINNGHTWVKDLTDEIDPRELERHDLVEYHILRSYGSDSEKKSRKDLEKAMDICDSLIEKNEDRKVTERTTEQISRILYRKAELSRSRGRSDEMIREYKRSLSYNRKYGGIDGIGKALNNLAMAYKDIDDLDRALELLIEAREVFEKNGNLTSISIIDLNRAEIYLEKRNRRKALKLVKKVEGMNISVPSISGRLKRRTGDIYKVFGLYDEALRSYEDALTAFMMKKDPNPSLDVLSSMVQVRIDKGDRKGVVETLKRADILVHKSLKEIGIQQKVDHLLDLHRSKLSKTKGSMKDDLLNDLASSENIKSVIKYIGRIKEEGKYVDGLIRSLEELGDSCLRKDNPHAAVILMIWTSKLYLDIGKRSNAKRILVKARKKAKNIGFDKALKMIQEIRE